MSSAPSNSSMAHSSSSWDIFSSLLSTVGRRADSGSVNCSDVEVVYDCALARCGELPDLADNDALIPGHVISGLVVNAMLLLACGLSPAVKGREVHAAILLHDHLSVNRFIY